MTVQGERAAERWKDRDFARSWAAGDSMADILDFPRRIAAAVVAHDNPAPRVVADVASGPGDLLAVFLDRFPSARGIWSDASDAMHEIARERLARFGDRVEYVVLDMTDLSALPTEVDVLTTSRAAHHLDRATLHEFYAAAAAHLAPGGWLVNLDHIGPNDVWDARLRAVRRDLAAAPDGPKHHHNYPLASVVDHLEGYRAAGIDDVEIGWRAFYTCLFLGRRGDAAAAGTTPDVA